jgi:hypothetical protein
MLLDLQGQSSSWSHWDDTTTQALEYRQLLNGYNHGGHTYVGGPICGLYAVCLTGVSFVNKGTAITFGRVILTSEDTITPWRQFHEYAHVIDYLDVGASRFGRDWLWGRFRADPDDGTYKYPDDGNWLEKSANERADAANFAWDAAGGSSSTQAGPRLLPGAVEDVFRTSSYS